MYIVEIINIICEIIKMYNVCVVEITEICTYYLRSDHGA